MPPLKILHTNDLHGKLDSSRLPFLLEKRIEADLYFDSGDCVKAGNLAVPLKPESVWPDLAKAKITASVPGNRESQVVEVGFKKKIEGHKHPILCCNMFKKDGRPVMPPSQIFEAQGLKVGVIGTMVAMVTENMASRHASHYLWEQPIPSAIAEAEKLRPQVDLLIALTHIGYTQDKKLAEQTDHFDIILGGHSHTVIEKPEKVGTTYICQGGSHGKFIGMYEWEHQELTGRLTPWETTP